MGVLDFSLSSAPQLISYIRTSLRLVHFSGVVLGLGGAVFLDLMLSRYRRSTVSAELVAHVEWISRFIAAGLLLLWISGLGFLFLYQVTDPEKLLNPKIWAKVTIVSILTINGFAIHRFVIPFIRRQIGSPLLAQIKPATKNALIGCGVISIVSWSVPVILGAAPQLNFVVPCGVILGGYALLLVQAFYVASFVIRDQRENHARRKKIVGELMVRGMLAGVIAGVFAFLFFRTFGEPWVETAIAMEKQTTSADLVTMVAEPGTVSRATQAGIGLLTGVLVYGSAIGGLFAIAFAFANGRLGNLSPRSTTMLLAAVGLVAITLVPTLKYPANPPFIGSDETIGARTGLYFAMMAMSLLAATVAIMGACRLMSHFGGWNASLFAGAGYFAFIALTLAGLPHVNEVPDTFPAQYLWNFRISSIAGHFVFWIFFGLSFDTLRQWRSHARPAIQLFGF